MLGRRIGLGLMLTALCLGASESAVAAEWPSGPRLTYVRAGAPIAGDQVISAEPSGDRWFKVATVWSLAEVDRPAYSPDGSKLAIGGFFLPSILVTSADHVEPRSLVGSAGGFAPVFSPDGKTVAFTQLRIRLGKDKEASFVGASIWLLPASGGKARQLTPWRNREVMLPASFSPDGATLLAERGRGTSAPEVVLQPLQGGRPRVVAERAVDPTFSPDGTRIAVAKFVRQPPEGRRKNLEPATDLFVLDGHGRALRRLTRTPDRQEEDPSWDPSGERLAFAQLPAREGRIGSSIVEINADGSCRRKIAFTLGLSYYSPVWQPGPGREAGRIEC